MKQNVFIGFMYRYLLVASAGIDKLFSSYIAKKHSSNKLLKN